MSKHASRLAVRALTYERGQRRILDAIDLKFESGAVTAVLGPNGVGKSTLLNCMAGLLKAKAGRIELDNVSIGRMAPSERARRISFLPQSPEIAWPVDVETFVGLARIPFHGVASKEQNHAAVVRAMACARVTQWAQRVVTTLSGGERARVLLARVLAGESDWIVADEPFTGLDPAHQFEAADLLRSFATAGTGVVITVHDLALAARIADRVLLLHEGRIVADGEPTQALTSSTLRQVYGIDAEWIVARRGAAPLIAIHGRHAS